MALNHAEELLNDIHNLGMDDDETNILDIAAILRNEFKPEHLVQLLANLAEIKRIASKELKRRIK